MLLQHAGRQLVDLALVQQQLARPLGLVIEAVGLTVLGDVRVDQPELAALHRGIGLGQVGVAGAQ